MTETEREKGRALMRALQERIMPTAEFERLFEETRGYVEHTFARSTCVEWMAELLAFCTPREPKEGDPRYELHLHKLACPEPRDGLRMMGVRAAKERLAVAGIFLILEVWKAPYASQEERDRGPSPRDHPLRTEQVWLIGGTMDGRQIGQAWDTLRGAGNAIRLGEAGPVGRSWAPAEGINEFNAPMLEEFWNSYGTASVLLNPDLTEKARARLAQTHPELAEVVGKSLEEVRTLAERIQRRKRGKRWN